MGDWMMHYMGKDVKTGKHMVYVSCVTGTTEIVYYDTLKEADAAIQEDFQAEREGNLLR